jgi:hypothetical protein
VLKKYEAHWEEKENGGYYGIQIKLDNYKIEESDKVKVKEIYLR